MYFWFACRSKPQSGLGTERVVPTGCGRECKGKILKKKKKGKIKTWCREKIPHGRVCYSVKTFPTPGTLGSTPRAWKQAPGTPSCAPACGPPGWPEGPCHVPLVRPFHEDGFCVDGGDTVRINTEHVPKLIGFGTFKIWLKG